jgi:hypothetical protein
MSIIDDAVFWSGFVTIVTGFLGLSIKLILKSKCKKFSCFCISAERDTEMEEKIEERELELSNIYKNKSIDNII